MMLVCWHRKGHIVAQVKVLGVSCRAHCYQGPSNLNLRAEVIVNDSCPLF